jgi:hypothetical protein
MTWLAPWALAAGGLGLLGVLAAHLLARQRPRALQLATARFLPPGMLEATALQRTPRDRWWMALRTLIVALLALGAAQPVLTGTRVPVRTVLLLDRTLPLTEQRRVIATLAPSDVVITFDTAASMRSAASVDLRLANDASLSAALALLVRTRDSLALNARSLRVQIASTFAASNLDPASAELRAELPDSIAVVPVTIPVRTQPVRGAVTTVGGERDDPVAASLVLVGDTVAVAGSRVQRGRTLSAEDSSAAAAGATVIWWPAARAPDSAAMHSVTVGNATWVGVFTPDSIGISIPGERPIGWWTNGTSAVWRNTVGNGCVLRMGIALPERGDQTLSLSAQRIVQTLLRLCEPAVPGEEPVWLRATSRKPATVDTAGRLRSALAPWLFGAALLLALTELAFRPRRSA